MALEELQIFYSSLFPSILFWAGNMGQNQRILLYKQQSCKQQHQIALFVATGFVSRVLRLFQNEGHKQIAIPEVQLLETTTHNKAPSRSQLRATRTAAQSIVDCRLATIALEGHI